MKLFTAKFIVMGLLITTSLSAFAGTGEIGSGGRSPVQTPTEGDNSYVIAVNKNVEAESIYNSLMVDAQEVNGEQVKIISTSSGFAKIICVAKDGFLFGTNYECLIQYSKIQQDQGSRVRSQRFFIPGEKGATYSQINVEEFKVSLNTQDTQELCSSIKLNPETNEFRSHDGNRLFKLEIGCEGNASSFDSGVIFTSAYTAVDRPNANKVLWSMTIGNAILAAAIGLIYY